MNYRDNLETDTTMDNSNIYNNELIGCISIYHILKHSHTLSPAKAMLILPLVCHNGILSYLNRANTDVKSIEQLLIRKPELISNFNERFYSLLNTSINSILMLNAMNFISIKEGLIYLIDEEKEFIPNKETKIIGKRAYKIIEASGTVSRLLDDKIDNLYLQLRVKL